MAVYPVEISAVGQERLQASKGEHSFSSSSFFYAFIIPCKYVLHESKTQKLAGEKRRTLRARRTFLFSVDVFSVISIAATSSLNPFSSASCKYTRQKVID